MCKEPPNDTPVNSSLVPTNKTLLSLMKLLEKAMTAHSIFARFFLQNLRVYWKKIGFGYKYR